MRILGIESSCDETSAAVYSDDGLLSNVVVTQAIHEKYGGVVPELASRVHVQSIMPVVADAIEQAKITKDEITGIAVTYGPGLVGSVLVGLNFAKAMSLALEKPLIGVNHMEGHIFSNFVKTAVPEGAFVTLVVSGGHTMLVYIREMGDYEIKGTTRDDAAGEAFDKVAKMLKLGYPGGPIVDKIASQGNPEFVNFPKPRFKGKNYDFSYSGLKTAVLYYLKQQTPEFIAEHTADIAASFQKAAVTVLADRTFELLRDLNVKILGVVGGVAGNSELRKKIQKRCDRENVRLYMPPLDLCTDNAAMIARAGYFQMQQGNTAPLTLSPKPSLPLTRKK